MLAFFEIYTIDRVELKPVMTSCENVVWYMEKVKNTNDFVVGKFGRWVR